MDNKVRVLLVKENVFQNNNKAADTLRCELGKKGVFLMNLMSSPGSGKTTLLTGIINRMKDKYRIGVMEADIDSDVDAVKIKALGVKAVQLHTGGMCHLDAAMTRQGLEAIGIDDLDFVTLENVGNLICPAEFDTGAVKNVMILSVPEGDDKPLKYPLMFSTVDAVIINKIDASSFFDFDIGRCRGYIRERNVKNPPVFPVSAKTGEGMDALVAWLGKEIEAWKNGESKDNKR